MAGQEEVIRRLRQHLSTQEGQIDALIITRAAEGESMMVEGAPWTDRTGNARASLSGTTDITTPRKRLVLSGGMPYSVWLELRWGGRYRIIWPTALRIASRLYDSLRRLKT